MCKKIQFRFPQTYIEGLQGNMRHFVIDSLHDGSKAFFCSETERQKKRQIQIPLQLLVSEDYTTAFLPSTSICTVYDFQHLTRGTNTKFRRHVFNFFFKLFCFIYYRYLKKQTHWMSSQSYHRCPLSHPSHLLCCSHWLLFL